MCDNIIGISKNPSICVPNLSISKSGLYLDDTSKGRIPLKQAFWSDLEVLERIIPEATEQAKRDLRIALSKRLVKRVMDLKTEIGFKEDFTGGHVTPGQYKYIVLRPKFSGATLNIMNLRAYTDTGVITSGFRFFKGGVELINPSVINFDESLYIMYQTTSNPLNIKHTTCCGRYANYETYAYVGSGYFNSDGTLSDIISKLQWYNDSYTQGIYLEGLFECDPLIGLCDLDFEKSIFGIVFAKLVQQIARQNIISYLMMNDSVTAYLDAKYDDLGLLSEYLNQDIETMLTYLPENYKMTDCYICNGIYKNEIII